MSDQLVAVADGVGGWIEMGVDPALFSKELCRHLWDEFIISKTLNLKQLLDKAVLKTKSVGSSTFVMAGLDPDAQGVLNTLNLGDSGYIIARKQDLDITLLYRSPEQLYGFNFPYQCGTDCDLPSKHSDNRTHILQDRDFLILASDGVFDNLFDEEILDCLRLSSNFMTDSDAEIAAVCIAKKSEVRSFDL